MVPPVSKRLACGDVGRGALASVSDIMERIAKCCEGMEGRRNSSAVGAWQRRGFQESVEIAVQSYMKMTGRDKTK